VGEVRRRQGLSSRKGEKQNYGRKGEKRKNSTVGKRRKLHSSIS